jgi:hypothetical protein
MIRLIRIHLLGYVECDFLVSGPAGSTIMPTLVACL